MNECNEVSEDSEDDWGVVDSEILPYQDEPLAAEDKARLRGRKRLWRSYSLDFSRKIWTNSLFGILVSEFIQLQLPFYPERSPTNRTSLGQRKRKTSLPWPFNLILFDRCRRQHSRTELLVGSIEFRCCREVTSTSGKMVFDGSIEKISCITQHEDYDAITNRAVLVQVAPLLRTKDGRTYHCRGGVSENEWVNTRYFVYGTSHKFLS